MRSAPPVAKPEAPAAKPVGALGLLWMLLQQIWALACRGEVRGLEDMLADAEAQRVTALRKMMADDPAFSHLAGLDYRLAFNGRDHDLVPVGGWTCPPTRFEDHESSAFLLALEVLDRRSALLDPRVAGLRRCPRMTLVGGPSCPESWSDQAGTKSRPSPEIQGSRFAWPRMTQSGGARPRMTPLETARPLIRAGPSQ